jgi:hypothetical protein
MPLVIRCFGESEDAEALGSTAYVTYGTVVPRMASVRSGSLTTCVRSASPIETAQRFLLRLHESRLNVELCVDWVIEIE